MVSRERTTVREDVVRDISRRQIRPKKSRTPAKSDGRRVEEGRASERRILRELERVVRVSERVKGVGSVGRG